MNKRTIRTALVTGLILAIGVLALVACGGGAPSPTPEPTATEVPTAAKAPTTASTEEEHAEGEEEHAEGEEGHAEGEEQHAEGEAGTHAPEEHVAGHHEVPAEAAAVENPIPATEESIEKGRKLYATNCAVCHGETGKGDGPAAANLEKQPANLHADHVQENSDGALFWIISHGRPETPMPAWEDVLTGEERWHVVNFLRTLQEEGE